MGSVTLTLEEHDALRARAADAWNEVTKLQAEIAGLKAQHLPAAELAIMPLARALLKVTQFAVGNLPPETTRYWPRSALLAAANDLHRLPDFSINDRDLAAELRAFCAKIDECEAIRAERGEPRHRG